VATAALVVIVCALYADTAAFVGNVPVQAMTCHVGVQFFGAVFARGDRQLLAGGIFLAAASAHLLVVHTITRGRARWLTGDRERGTRSLLANGLLALTVALAVVVVPYSWLPLPERAKIDLRKLADPNNDRRVVSPLVSVSAQLTDQRDSVMFTARHPGGPRYWRLTALDSFDGRTWSSKATYDTPLPLPEPSADFVGEYLSQEVTIKNLGGIWLPLLYRPEFVDTSLDIAFDGTSESFILSKDTTLGKGDVYRALSRPIGTISSTSSPAPRGSGEQDGTTFTELPRDTDPAIVATALEFTGGATDPLTAMRNMQFEFRTFTYSTDVDYSGEADPTLAFLWKREGFCQQFSSTFAVMARSLGYPSRIAVGFTHGDYDPDTDLWTVRGRQAHAWPEVWLPDLGWTPFEPTPGRGDPSVESLTGVPGSQDDQPAGATSGATGSTSTTAPRPTATAAPATTTPAPTDSTSNRPDDSPPWWILAVASVPLLLGGLWWLAARRRAALRSFEGLEPRETVRRAWSNAVADLGSDGIDFQERETIDLFAHRVASELDDPELVELANLVETAWFADSPPSAADADRAREISKSVEQRLELRLSWGRRLARRVAMS
jgi:transglutaminase-like putative cysteine protease